MRKGKCDYGRIDKFNTIKETVMPTVICDIKVPNSKAGYATNSIPQKPNVLMKRSHLSKPCL